MSESLNSSEKLNGKWVILLDEHIIDSGDNIKELIERVEKKTSKKKVNFSSGS